MRIAIHAFDGITMFHVASPLAVFGEVARLGIASDWQTQVWSHDGLPVRTAEGPILSDVAGPEVVEQADLLVLPSWHADLRTPEEPLVGLIQSAHIRGTEIAGLCLGAFPVAAAGILDGRSAVTHWRCADQLQVAAPRVDVDPDALYLDHGDVMTSAGTASALDACLHLVRKHLGADAATKVARQLVIAPHRDGGQAQYIERPLPVDVSDDAIQGVMNWALANLDQPLAVADLAARARMSTRNFTRKFRELTGATPAQWVTEKRLDESRRLLETTSWTVERVARTCGYGSPVTFRQSFLAAYGTPPSAYRKHFTNGVD
ncbi:GlxA family transcriptional regulator [Corynebacterium lubricantis]|uniref:GlxA family transcriptional regulator n=1 Tax=Corynebacterium lubricantis TaxID=541095 RepID=UPI0004754719|nr:helix-turn-helix domain-containing protein [Corynebacterium lubricantis]